jgi:thiamine pyrophosphokinase
MSRLSLPRLEIATERAAEVETLLVLGGRAPAPEWLRQAASGRAVWAVDRGAEACRTAGIVPDYALGDFDSLNSEGRAWLEKQGVGTEVYPPDKDYTDFQLALNRAGGAGKGLLVTGCWGGRFDHAFANVFSILWGREWGAEVRAFADEAEVLIPLSGKNGENALTLRFRSPPLAVSLLPLSPLCEGVSVLGTKWELKDAAIFQARPYAISNVPVGNEAAVSLSFGVLGVYCVFE